MPCKRLRLSTLPGSTAQSHQRPGCHRPAGQPAVAEVNLSSTLAQWLGGFRGVVPLRTQRSACRPLRPLVKSCTSGSAGCNDGPGEASLARAIPKLIGSLLTDAVRVPAAFARNIQDAKSRPRAHLWHSRMCDRSLREMVTAQMHGSDASGLGDNPAYFALGDLAKGDNDLSVIRVYERLGTF